MLLWLACQTPGRQIVRELLPIVFTRGTPTTDVFSLEEVSSSFRTAIEHYGLEALQYGNSFGFPPLCRWLADRYGVEADQVLTSNGSLQLLDLLCHPLVSPGDVVFTEEPTYDRAIVLLRRHGTQIEGIPLEPDGPDLDQLEAALSRHFPKFFYIIPDFQNPSGATCSLDKRRRIVELAKLHNFWLVEDTPYRLLRYRGEDEPTLFELAPDRVLHLNSFSKVIVPGTRVGFVVGPKKMVARIARVAEDTYITPGILGQAIVFEYCNSGFLQPQLKRLKTAYVPRLQAALEGLDKHLPSAQTTRPEGGFFLSLTLPQAITCNMVRSGAASENLTLTDGEAFFPNGGGERFLRLPFCAMTPEQIEAGIFRLAEVVAELQE